MDLDFPHSPPKTLPQDMQRACSMSAPTAEDEALFPALRPCPASGGVAGVLNADMVALIRGDVPDERKRLLYSNSLRRRSIDVAADAP